MLKFVPLLVVLLDLAPAFSQALQVHKDGVVEQVAVIHGVHDDKQRRREELRAALKAQSDDASAPSTKPITSQERAALREQVRVQGHTSP